MADIISYGSLESGHLLGSVVILELIHANIFKSMQVRGRRIYLPRNIFNVLPARSGEHTCLRIFPKCRLRVIVLTTLGFLQIFKFWRLVLVGHTGRTVPAFGVAFTAALTEIISAFPET